MSSKTKALVRWKTAWKRSCNAVLVGFINAAWIVALSSLGAYVGTLLWAEDRFKQSKESIGRLLVGSFVVAMVMVMTGWSIVIFWLSYRAILALLSSVAVG
jgi:hypothetical protein